MFFKKKRVPECNNDSYVRWLRAQRPPFEWFLLLSELEQEQLATHGDEQWAAVAGAIAEELRGEDGTAPAGAPMSEAEMATAAAREVLGHLKNRAPSRSPEPEAPARTSFAGFGDEMSTPPDDGKPERAFLGKAPDGKETIA